MRNKQIQKTKLKRLVTTGAIGLLAAGSLLAQVNNVDKRTRSFMEDAAQGNVAEISLAQVAQERSQNSDIKKLAQTIRDDHQKANQQLEKLAQTRGVKLDETPSMMQKHTLNKLEKLTGLEFDQLYATEMLKEHASDLKTFSKAGEKIEDPQVKQFAQEMIPKLQTHLQLAAKAARAVGVDESTITSYLNKATAAATSSDTGLAGK